MVRVENVAAVVEPNHIWLPWLASMLPTGQGRHRWLRVSEGNACGLIRFMSSLPPSIEHGGRGMEIFNHLC